MCLHNLLSHPLLHHYLFDLLQMVIDLSFFFDLLRLISGAFLLGLVLVLALLTLMMLLLLHLLEHIDTLEFFLLLLDEALDLHIHVLNFIL